MMWICVVHVDCTILRCCTVLRHFILLLDLPGFRIDVLILGLKQNLGIHLSTIFFVVSSLGFAFFVLYQLPNSKE